jgi:hypothetical protein
VSLYLETGQGKYTGLGNTTVHTYTKGECMCVGAIRLVIRGTSVVKAKVR